MNPPDTFTALLATINEQSELLLSIRKDLDKLSALHLKHLQDIEAYLQAN